MLWRSRLLDEKEFSLKRLCALPSRRGNRQKVAFARCRISCTPETEMPRVYKDTPMQEAILEMTGKKLGWHAP